MVNEHHDAADAEQVRIAKEDILGLPYQLFAGAVGTVLEAKACRATVAVLVVHQFRTCWTRDSDIKHDSELYCRFVQRLILANRVASHPTTVLSLEDGKLVGPVYFGMRDCGTQRWNLPTDLPLLLGKITTDRIPL
jgi:hypothetical protein